MCDVVVSFRSLKIEVPWKGYCLNFLGECMIQSAILVLMRVLLASFDVIKPFFHFEGILFVFLAASTNWGWDFSSVYGLLLGVVGIIPLILHTYWRLLELLFLLPYHVWWYTYAMSFQRHLLCLGLQMLIIFFATELTFGHTAPTSWTIPCNVLLTVAFLWWTDIMICG